jgi:RNA polymerase sigma factor (sigma-70 family)
MGAVKFSEKTEWLDKQVRAYEQRLVRYTSRFVSVQVAREVVQESFIRLWNHGENGVRGHEREWLFCVCRNLSIDHIRRERRVMLMDEEGVLVPATEEILSFAEEASQLQMCVATLKPAQREVIRLKYQENMSYAEISSVTGHSVSYVGVLIHQAMEKMRQQLSGSDKAGRTPK